MKHFVIQIKEGGEIVGVLQTLGQNPQGITPVDIITVENALNEHLAEDFNFDTHMIGINLSGVVQLTLKNEYESVYNLIITPVEIYNS